MVTQEEINRINELAHLKKERPLTDEELAEQKALRQKYIESIRAAVKSNLDNIEIVDPDDPRLAAQKRNNVNS